MGSVSAYGVTSALVVEDLDILEDFVRGIDQSDPLFPVEKSDPDRRLDKALIELTRLTLDRELIHRANWDMPTPLASAGLAEGERLHSPRR